MGVLGDMFLGKMVLVTISDILQFISQNSY